MTSVSRSVAWLARVRLGVESFVVANHRLHHGPSCLRVSRLVVLLEQARHNVLDEREAVFKRWSCTQFWPTDYHNPNLWHSLYQNQVPPWWCWDSAGCGAVALRLPSSGQSWRTGPSGSPTRDKIPTLKTPVVAMVSGVERSQHTWATEVVIFVPPEPPTTIFTFPFSNMRVGHMEDKGLFPLKENVCEVHVDEAVRRRAQF